MMRLHGKPGAHLISKWAEKNIRLHNERKAERLWYAQAEQPDSAASGTGQAVVD